MAPTSPLKQCKGIIVIIPMLQYKGHEVHAYVQHRDHYAAVERRYSAVIWIDTIPFNGARSRRYTTQFMEDGPVRDGSAMDLAMQYGRGIIDGAVQADAR